MWQLASQWCTQLHIHMFVLRFGARKELLTFKKSLVMKTVTRGSFVNFTENFDDLLKSIV